MGIDLSFVVTSEWVSFEVDGPGRIVGPGVDGLVKTEFGTATVLLRSSTEPGEIRITARANGLKPGTAGVTSAPSIQPLAYDPDYAKASRQPAGSAIVVVHESGDLDASRLREELHRLQLELTSKEQDLMELRSKVGK